MLNYDESYALYLLQAFKGWQLCRRTGVDVQISSQWWEMQSFQHGDRFVEAEACSLRIRTDAADFCDCRGNWKENSECKRRDNGWSNIANYIVMSHSHCRVKCCINNVAIFEWVFVCVQYIESSCWYKIFVEECYLDSLEWFCGCVTVTRICTCNRMWPRSCVTKWRPDLTWFQHEKLFFCCLEVLFTFRNSSSKRSQIWANRS